MLGKIQIASKMMKFVQKFKWTIHWHINKEVYILSKKSSVKIYYILDQAYQLNNYSTY